MSTAVGSVTRVIGRIPILDVEPAVECGRRPARAVNGETFGVSATIFREGHGIINAGVVLRDPERKASPVLFIFCGLHGGMAPATFACVFIAALGDRESTFKSSFLLAAGITLFGVILFAYVLKIPFQVVRPDILEWSNWFGWVPL